MRKFLFLLWLLLPGATMLQGQTASGFGSVLAISSNTAYGSLPVINLGGSDVLHVGFDDLEDRDIQLRYRVVMLNADGSVSDLREIEYMSGINQTDISESDLSFNTRTNYVHYSFDFPQGGRNVKLSGTYRFEIFESSHPETVLLQIPFMVCEAKADISVKIKAPKRVQQVLTHQELEVSVNTRQLQPSVQNAERNLKVFAQQNLNPMTLRRLPLTYQLGDDFFYQDKDENVFEGLNEFRNFDIRPIRHSGRGVDFTEVRRERWNAQLLRQKSREYGTYLSDDDINGDYAVKAEYSDNSDVEAEYVNVHFVLEETENPFRKIYAVGKFNNWRCDKQSLMEYREGIRAYTLTCPLKQGFYDYMFVTEENGEIALSALEGNHQETENDYYIYVFYREPGGRYDRLLGVKRTNSRGIIEK